MVLMVISLIFVFVGVFLLIVMYDGYFLDISFEVVSVFGIVGFLCGYMGELLEFGCVVIIVIMFLGCVGLLMFGFFFVMCVVLCVCYLEGKVYLGWEIYLLDVI